jgi:hypothetical protein
MQQQNKQPANWIHRLPIVENQVTVGYTYISDKGAVMVKKLDQFGVEKFVICLQKSQAEMLSLAGLGTVLESPEYQDVLKNKVSRAETERHQKIIQKSLHGAQAKFAELKSLGLTPEQIMEIVNKAG